MIEGFWRLLSYIRWTVLSDLPSCLLHFYFKGSRGSGPILVAHARVVPCHPQFTSISSEFLHSFPQKSQETSMNSSKSVPTISPTCTPNISRKTARISINLSHRFPIQAFAGEVAQGRESLARLRPSISGFTGTACHEGWHRMGIGWG